MAIPANCTQCGRPISQARLVNGAMKCKGCVRPTRPALDNPRWVRAVLTMWDSRSRGRLLRVQALPC